MDGSVISITRAKRIQQRQLQIVRNKSNLTVDVQHVSAAWVLDAIVDQDRTYAQGWGRLLRPAKLQLTPQLLRLSNSTIDQKQQTALAILLELLDSSVVADNLALMHMLLSSDVSQFHLRRLIARLDMAIANDVRTGKRQLLDECETALEGWRSDELRAVNAAVLLLRSNHHLGRLTQLLEDNAEFGEAFVERAGGFQLKPDPFVRYLFSLQDHPLTAVAMLRVVSRHEKQWYDRDDQLSIRDQIETVVNEYFGNNSAVRSAWHEFRSAWHVPDAQ